MPVFTDYPTTKQTSLNDILGPLATLQQYKQAQQLNPLQVQKAQLELQQAQAMNPLALRQQAAETRVSEETANPRIESAKAISGQQQTAEKKAALDFTASQSAIAKQILGGIRNLPQIKNAGDDPKAAMGTLDVAKDLMVQSGLPEDTVNSHLKIIKDHIGNKPQLLPNVLDNIIGGGLTPQQQQTLQTPQLTTDAIGNPALYRSGPGTLTPAQIQQPNAPMGQPMPQGGPLPQGMQLPSGMPSAMQQGVTPTQMQLQYPVRRAGDIRPLSPSEKTDQEAGQTYRNTLVNHATNLTTQRRNLDEIIKQAQDLGEHEWGGGAGFLGMAGRNLSTFLGTEQGVRYKELSKDLANAQLSNMKALGLSTDADKTLTAAANGDYTYPPDVLINIARRTQADMTNVELQAKGAQAFAKKYGDNNLKTYQEKWADNAKDSRVFEAIAINNSDLTKEEKIDKIDKLFKGASAQEIDKLTRQKNNLLKLSRTGEL